MDLIQPSRLVALPGADRSDNPICENRWDNAATTYDIADMNTLSHWGAVSDQDWEVLRGLGNAFLVANANNHVSFDFCTPFMCVRDQL